MDEKKIADPHQAGLRMRMETVLLADHLEEEIKNMIEQGSGCGFVALVKVLHLLDSPMLKNRIKQQELIDAVKKNYGSLSAYMQPIDILLICKQLDLGIEITTFYYLKDFGLEEVMVDHLKSSGLELNFPLISFRLKENPLVLEPGEVAIIGLENKTRNDGHFICSDKSGVLSSVNNGGVDELRKYIEKGFIVTDVFVFKKLSDLE